VEGRRDGHSRGESQGSWCAALDPEAVTHWFMVYMTYLRNMVSSVAGYLYCSIGEHAAIMQFGNIVEEAIMNSFHV